MTASDRSLRSLVCIAIGTALLCGCSVRQRQEMKYYTLSLDLPAPPLPEATQATTARPAPVPVQKTLLLRRFWAKDPYGQTRMIYRSSPYQLDFYHYHLWAASPADQVHDWTTRYLRKIDLFSRVSSLQEARGDLELGGVLRQFEEVDRDSTWEAVISIDFWMMRADERSPCWFRSYGSTTQARRRTPEAVAEAMSRNLERVLRQLADDLEKLLQKPPDPERRPGTCG